MVRTSRRFAAEKDHRFTLEDLLDAVTDMQEIASETAEIESVVIYKDGEGRPVICIAVEQGA